MRRIRTLIVDDAVVVRQLLSKVLAEDPQIEVVGAAPNGKVAVERVAQQPPDIVVLDVEMPEMDGLEALSAIKAIHPKLPVIMFSTMTERGAAVTMDALCRGAADYVTKPTNPGSVIEAMQRIRSELVPRIKVLCGVGSLPFAAASPRGARPVAAQPSGPGAQTVELLAIGCSTGGPNALADLLPLLPPSPPVPIVIVQHMPPIFTRLLAERLSKKSGLSVREAADGDLLEPGTAFMAPGNYHMVLSKEGLRIRVKLHQGPPENSCRPAVDVLFRSVAPVFGARTLAVILTGMGQDGLRGCQDIRSAGGRVLVQDEASSVVWGMPGAVATAGLADRVMPLHALGAEISRRLAEGRHSSRAKTDQHPITNGPVS